MGRKAILCWGGVIVPVTHFWFFLFWSLVAPIYPRRVASAKLFIWKAFFKSCASCIRRDSVKQCRSCFIRGGDGARSVIPEGYNAHPDTLIDDLEDRAERWKLKIGTQAPQ